MPLKSRSQIYEVDFTVWGDTFQKQLTNRIEMFDGNRDYHSWASGRLNKYAICLSAAATILIGVTANFESQRPYLTSAALVCTAVTTAVQTWAAVAGYRKSSVFYSDGGTRLWEIQRDLDHIGKEPDDAARAGALKALYAKFQRTLRDLHEQWKQLASEQGHGRRGTS